MSAPASRPAPTTLMRWQQAAYAVLRARGAEVGPALQALAEAREAYEMENSMGNWTLNPNPPAGQCRIQDCIHPIVARGLCAGHHSSVNRAGRLEEFALPVRGKQQQAAARKAPRSPVEPPQVPAPDHAAESAGEPEAPAAHQDVPVVRIDWTPTTTGHEGLFQVAPDEATLALRSMAELLQVEDYGDEPERVLEAVRRIRERVERLDARLMEMEDEKNSLTDMATERREERDGARRELDGAVAKILGLSNDLALKSQRIADLEQDLKDSLLECHGCHGPEYDDCDGEDVPYLLGFDGDNHYEGAIYALRIPTLIDTEGPECEVPILPTDCYEDAP